jgi:shikimate dehydrogenase
VQEDRRLLSTGRRAAVLGSPITHSRSPVLHNAAYAALGLDDWFYTAHEVREHELADFVDGLGREWVGLSLTMPLKRVALAVATEASGAATAIGAANTLVLDGPDRRAENTDAPGMVDALRAAGVGAVERPVLLGAGGTAQAAVWAIAQLTDEPLTVAVRDPARAADLRTTADRLGVRVVLADVASVQLARADLIVSTLPKGAADAFAHGGFAPGAVLFDVVYDPWPTALAAAAQAAGCRIVSGLDLLLHQAGHQVTLMTGQPAPLAAMRAAL